ncbi:MAG: leucine--tRNA ligase [Patescibacteria group bacterium]|nr:leucine--tRNA ligase [Patescibacteria group bacterium]
MANKYPFQDIEQKWQKWWEDNGIYHAKQPSDTKDKKFYTLVEFPYPSGDGLHVGHPRSYTALDIVSRKKRMEGLNVMYPIGWDAFGLPTENAAIKKKMQPAIITEKNVATFKRQTQSLGTGFDWSREINTTDPKYYKWTQWMFIQFYNAYFDESLQKARPITELEIPAEIQKDGDLAIRNYRDSKRIVYKTTTTINWCPACKIGLSNEEAQGGVCERCGGEVEKREKEQWMMRITKYANRLIDELSDVNYLDKIKTQQINWIGRSEGALIKFAITQNQSQDHVHRTIDEIEVFTTRPDTLFGATYLVLSPEHPLLTSWIDHDAIENIKEVKDYQETTRKKSDRERQENKEKTGVEIHGLKAVNPATGKEVPVWIADYVLAGYGTGAIMAVPAHDERDYEFAKKFELPIIKVVVPPALAELSHPPANITPVSQEDVRVESECWIGEGISINSEFLNDLTTDKSQEKIVAWLEEHGAGHGCTNYKQRDWVFSRQRYWGEPIPMIHCEKCGWQPVAESELPILLPDVENYEPTDSGESPLSVIIDWVNTTCPACGGNAKRETDTMPNWAGSSWYFLRYCDAENDQVFASPEALKYWMPVDLYDGGMEHTTLHLLYSRFWYKVLHDLGHIPESCGVEPYAKRTAHGMILGEGGIKMSKSKGNVVNPDDVISEYGSDVFRCYEMFMGPFDTDAPWDTHGIQGIKRFLDKIWSLHQTRTTNDELRTTNPSDAKFEIRNTKYESILHKSIKKVGDDIDAMRFNTAISQLMILTNTLLESESVTDDDYKTYLKLIAPFAPHIAEQIWHNFGNESSIHLEAWPTYNPDLLIEDTITLGVQINGKVRGEITIAPDAKESEAMEAAMQDENVKKYLDGTEPKKVIYVPGRILNIVI